MHITQITLSNFRSFRHQATSEKCPEFSSGLNALIGRNGAGKSNLFDAVQFVLLAPKFANLRQEERQALLHEGAGSAAVNAYVEIVFDNSDHRIGLENSDEVVLRRTIGLQKDEFFLQRRKATKKDVQSLLEGAGFSKSNPYYIVQQGKVQDLCTMSDVERLTLLKEVAGTTVYDEKRAESLVKMEENNTSINKITEILVDIETRLAQLQSEKEELVVYQQHDRQRRSLEYTLYEKELCKARTVLDQIENERCTHVETVADLHAAAKQTHDDIQNLTAKMNTKSNILRRNRTTIRQLEDDARNAVTKTTRLELGVAELQERLQSLREQATLNQASLHVLEREIASKQTELDETVLPAYNQAVAELNQMTVKRDDVAAQIEALYAKQGRGKQFTSAEDRDVFLRDSIQELETAKTEKQHALGQQQDALSNLRRTIGKEVKEIAACTQQVTEKANDAASLQKQMDEKKRQRSVLQEARQEAWRTANELSDKVGEARDTFHRSRSNCRKSMPRNTAMGIDALKTIVEQERLTSDQYFGMLLDNMELKNERYTTAVEVAAQNSLFHVIVDTDATAARLMKRLEEEKLGRVTFLPLNQLRVDTSVKYPTQTSDVRPLLDSCINYDKRVDRAMQHVFGKKLLAKTPEIASEWSTKVSMDTITLEGDLCSRKGALTGGYVDATKSRLRAYKQQQEAKQALTLMEKDFQKANQEAQKVDQETTNLVSELQRLEAQRGKLSQMVAGKETDLERLEARLEAHTKQADNVEKTTIPPLERGIIAIEADIARLQEEIGTELQETLSENDRELLAELKKVQADLIPQIEAKSDEVAQVGVKRTTLKSLLEDNLLKRRKELAEGVSGDVDEGQRLSRGRLSSAGLEAQHTEELEERQQELSDAIRIKEEIESRLDKARETNDELRGELLSAKNELEQLTSHDLTNKKALEEAQDKSERLLNKRAMSLSSRETYQRKIEELGSLPPHAELEKFSDKSFIELMKLLEGVNRKLKKYSHVNKKAMDQYVNFNDQRDALLKRKEELDQGAFKIVELVESLDQQKNEAINRTFRGVSAHFKDVFHELVPNGSGELIMRTAIEEDDDEEGDGQENAREKQKSIDSDNPDVNLYRGVVVKVRFSAVGENFLMSQLSGGQKALVAMALIFAIQRCDPAPFYLFDELDQALDSTYRAAVAALIQKQANDKENPTQFIVSTFRPELVQAANSWYAIDLQNKISSLVMFTKVKALGFVANLLDSEEAVGEVSTVPTSKVSRASTRTRKRKVESEDEENSPKSSTDDSTP